VNALKVALYEAVALVAFFVVHEVAQARVAAHLGDDSALRQGRGSFNPVAHADPMGTYLLPGLLLLIVAAGRPFVPPFAYGKPMPLEPNRMRRPSRDLVLTLLAGPAATFALSVVVALWLRIVPPGEGRVVLAAFLIVGIMMTVFQLMPIPPLDGSKIVARFLPPRAGEVMDQLQVYGGLFMIIIIFVLSAPVLGIVRTLGNALCRVLVGFPCL
jgi:Zn-dependent protease